MSVNKQIGGQTSALRLSGRVQHYPWGKLGAASRIAPFVGEPRGEFPLAEYWIGAHPKAPSSATFLDGTTVSLGEAINRNPEGILGQATASRFGARLPFMVKVLSVNGDFGLSIQLHPTKEKARELHRVDPDHYPDDEHKPEVGIAITPVTLLYGCKPLNEVRSVVEHIVPLRKALPEELVGELSQPIHSRCEAAVVKRIFAALFTLSEERVAVLVRALREMADQSVRESEVYQIFQRLSGRYGDYDRGLPLIFLLNLVRLEPGQGIFIGANIPHAYLEGDLFECMACSDNVVRGGLTPKFIDLSTLLEVVDCSPPQDILRVPLSETDGLLRYPTPTEEFQVRVSSRSSSTFSLTTVGAPCVLLCLGDFADVKSRQSGDSYPLRDGGALLLPANSGDYQVTVKGAQVFCVTPGGV